MKALILVLLCAFCVLLLTEERARACDSAIHWSLPLMIEDADRIVIAEATSHQEAIPVEALRGSTKTLPKIRSSCDPYFEPGNRYLVFLHNGNYYPDTSAVRLVGANAVRVLAFVKAYIKVTNQQEAEAVRLKTIRQELLVPHSAMFEYDLLRDAVGYSRQAFVPATLDNKARSLLNTAKACTATRKHDWFTKASRARHVGIFEATSTGSTLLTNWSGSATAGAIPDAIVGARYLLVRNAASDFVVAPILLEGDAGDHVQLLKKWFVRGRGNRLDVLMNFVRANKLSVVYSLMCQYSAKRLIVDALSELQRGGYLWKRSDCSLLKRFTAASFARDLPIHRSLNRRCRRRSK